ncbi:adenylate/guanylate cyclase domain-containing protein [Mitsuaria sp. CC2]|uniref:adenylate/guanylate cyclase domain-containing protein n=1 Tax=Mitsuaria sp. CC2 TaxID=3029186 RepID=UPI003B8C6FA8
MTIREDLASWVTSVAVERWPDIPNATAVPSTDTLAFGNDGKRAEVTILYADISGSTKMVDEVADTRAAEYYKAFLHCASALVRRHGGDIQAYDGDRVMGVFIGAGHADNAVGAALELNNCVQDLINPIFARIYSDHQPIRFTVGIDSGVCLAVKVGVRAVGELAWIGPAANYAAKLNSFPGLDGDFPIRVTAETFQRLTFSSLYGSQNELIWDGPYADFPSRAHYRTLFHRRLA